MHEHYLSFNFNVNPYSDPNLTLLVTKYFMRFFISLISLNKEYVDFVYQVFKI